MYADRFVKFCIIVAVVRLTDGWKRYETRVLDCPDSNATSCTMELPKGVKQNINCRREPIPDSERTKLNKDATHRLACPVGCKIHIVQQTLSLSRKCLNFSTFGKYYDATAKDWYIWMCDPCRAVFKTNCEYDE
ncbi:hypothetical protein Y032_0104g3630 [Ancylostoma ceylanicum]|nr:hypothetical protein Y032_0104g3630 [Ancylostoma ceylanicum]